MPYAQINHRKLYYAQSRARSADAPVLVLIHGAGGEHLHWPAELRRLPDATVYALDLPGHGRSDGPGCTSIPEYVESVVRFLDATSTDRAVLAGHSMGGAISQLTALTHPERVAGLVLVGTGARLRVHPKILEGITTDFDGTLDLITRWLWAEGAPAELMRRGREAMGRLPLEVLRGDWGACDAFDVMDRLGEIAAPTLVVAGTADLLTPLKYGQYLAANIPNARLVTVEGGGHMMALEQPEVVAGAVSAFLGDLA